MVALCSFALKFRFCGRRHGELGLRDIPRGETANRRGHVFHGDEEGHSENRVSRASPPVVRKPGDYGVVGCPVAQRGVRQVGWLKSSNFCFIALAVSHRSDGVTGRGAIGWRTLVSPNVNTCHFRQGWLVCLLPCCTYPAPSKRQASTSPTLASGTLITCSTVN